MMLKFKVRALMLTWAEIYTVMADSKKEAIEKVKKNLLQYELRDVVISAEFTAWEIKEEVHNALARSS